MGYDYALVHLKYTVPPALALTLLYRPLLTRLDVYKILFLIAVVSTIPWDSYLIRTRVWTYPAYVILGPTLFDIPAEELFFFVIQTYNTSLLYLLLSKPVFFPVYLRAEGGKSNALQGRKPSWRKYQWTGQAVLALGIGLSLRMVQVGGRGTYIGLIILWAFPFLLLLWSLAYQFILAIPRSSSTWPIVVPTLYLWIVDTLALRRGTWVIEAGTKLGIHLWPGLEIEEAFFFLVTNTLIVFGLIAFDNALTILYTWRLRIDLILLYSFCRVADDLIDNASDCKEAREWIRKLRMYLDLSYKGSEEGTLLQDYVEIKFPPEAQSALRFLPTSYLSRSRMGVALQYVNISRDIAVDAQIQRVYIPVDWLGEKELTPAAVIKNPQDAVHSRPSSTPKLSAMDEKARQKTAVVIGAGVGGVATAARLAKAGYQVTVVEKNDFTGGRCSLIEHNGFRFDQGPSLLLLPNLFAEAFHDLGTSLEAEGVHLLKCEPNYNLWFGDGHSFELSTDLARMKREIERWEGKDGFERYLRFLQEAHRHYELSVTHVLKRNFTTLLSMARWSFLKHLLELHPFESIYSRASKYFWTERLRRVFTFGSMYMGMSPFDAPGTYSLLQYTELAEGIWYPEGGFHKVVDALVKVGQKLGVEYRLSTPVSHIALSPDQRRATGVVLASGETLHADVVVNNSDLVYAYNNLLPQTPYARSLTRKPASCSSISFYWSLSRTVPELRAHNIFLADSYRTSFDSIFKHQQIPAEPSFYVNVPSRIDASAAPPGHDAVVVLVPVGHLVSTTPSTSSASTAAGQDWQRMRALARATVLDTIRARTGADLAPLIRHERVNDPAAWRDAFNLDRGAILGLSHDFFNVLSFRPKTRHPSIRGLYFVGASTHPGTGVPICLAGSKVTVEQVVGDGGGEAVVWGHGGTGKKREREGIDRVEGGTRC
ncbi:putative phytoene dehydrogenase protein [Neofusicoccum parvum UCRNP2]|uniref:Bifunctional lycopene cyclase/phytoene synthase n=1 Tax=Botryosphaeria parva (strain UCR-NP2) TaxID=1287680 RepID=R1EE55_BOTPV|nr:putative phytoene dehydrogenase protein [Neofusicoccum parvum UCRNP2]